MLFKHYASNEDDPNFSKEITALLTTQAEEFIIVGEDFNCVLNQKLDKHPFEQGPILQKTNVLRNMIEDYVNKPGAQKTTVTMENECFTAESSRDNSKCKKKIGTNIWNTMIMEKFQYPTYEK